MPKRLKILIADDEPSIREILSIQLARLGFEVLLAEDGQEAVDMYEKDRPDLILMDLMMPRLDGLKACEKIRAFEKRISRRAPIIFLTARDTRHDKTSAALSGGDDFVAKPISLQELRERLDLALKKIKP